MPGPLEASFEVQVAEYLKQLFGSRTTERRTALRVAQERVDQQRAESSSQISLGTLRAIAIDRTDGSSSSQTPSRISSPLLNRNTPTPTPAPTPKGRSKQAFAALAGALALLAGGLILKMPSASSGPAKVGTGGMVPVETIMLPPSKVAPPPAASEARATPIATASAEAERATDSGKKAPREHKPAARSVRALAASSAPATPSNGSAAAATAANGTPTTSTPAAAAAAPGVSTSSSNTLGRGAFGGRH